MENTSRACVYKRGTNSYDYYDSLLKSTILSLFSYVLARCATMGLLHPLVFAIDICLRICYRARACAMTTSTCRRATTTMGNYLGKQTRSLRQHERRPSYTHTAAPILGPRAATPGVAANPGPSVDVSLRVFCCELIAAAPTGRVPGLRGAFIIASTPSLLCWFRGPTSRYCCAVEC